MYHASSSTSTRCIENAKVLAFVLNKSHHTRLTHEVCTFHIFYQFQTGAQCATDHDQGVMGFLVVARIVDCIPAAPLTTDQQRGLKKQRAQEHFHHLFNCSNIPSDAVGPSSFFQLPVSNLPVESSPSTASQQGANDPYHMQRLSTAHTGTAETRPSITSIREIHDNLPPSIQKKGINMQYPDSHQRKQHPSSTIADTAMLSLTPSMLEQDSRDGLVKCIYHPPLTLSFVMSNSCPVLGWNLTSTPSTKKTAPSQRSAHPLGQCVHSMSTW